MTKKGRGYEPAEKDPITFHAVPKFDHTSGFCRKAAAACRAIRKSSATGCAKPRRKTTS
jgi:1-deoxy-D-xylulose-5-phosphate synthase